MNVLPGIPKPAPNDYLQRWPVSKGVNSSKADADDVTLIEGSVQALVAASATAHP